MPPAVGEWAVIRVIPAISGCLTQAELRRVAELAGVDKPAADAYASEHCTQLILGAEVMIERDDTVWSGMMCAVRPRGVPDCSWVPTGAVESKADASNGDAADDKPAPPKDCAAIPPKDRTLDCEDGQDAYKRGNFAEALRLWRPLADGGNADAQLGLGRLYDNGVGGVPLDHVQAATWYRKAAEQGNVLAQLHPRPDVRRRGTRRAGGPRAGRHVVPQGRRATERRRAIQPRHDVPRRRPRAGGPRAGRHVVPQGRRARECLGAARPWHGVRKGRRRAAGPGTGRRVNRKAAEQGNADAQWGLGEKYENGEGVPQDYAQAFVWYRKAADQNDLYVKDRDALAAKMTPAQIAEAQRLARERKPTK